MSFTIVRPTPAEHLIVNQDTVACALIIKIEFCAEVLALLMLMLNGMPPMVKLIVGIFIIGNGGKESALAMRGPSIPHLYGSIDGRYTGRPL